MNQETEKLRGQFINLQVRLAELFPPLEGERANDPIIVRVETRLNKLLRVVDDALAVYFNPLRDGGDKFDAMKGLQDYVKTLQTYMHNPAQAVSEPESLPAYKTLVNELITAGCKISVFDGEEYNPSQSTDADSILAAIESVEVAELLIYVPNRPALWAQVSPYGLAPDETVIDHTIGLEQYAPSLKFDIAEG